MPGVHCCMSAFSLYLYPRVQTSFKEVTVFYFPKSISRVYFLIKNNKYRYLKLFYLNVKILSIDPKMMLQANSRWL